MRDLPTCHAGFDALTRISDSLFENINADNVNIGSSTKIIIDKKIKKTFCFIQKQEQICWLSEPRSVLPQ